MGMRIGKGIGRESERVICISTINLYLKLWAGLTSSSALAAA